MVCVNVQTVTKIQLGKKLAYSKLPLSSTRSTDDITTVYLNCHMRCYRCCKYFYNHAAFWHKRKAKKGGKGGAYVEERKEPHT